MTAHAGHRGYRLLAAVAIAVLVAGCGSSPTPSAPPASGALGTATAAATGGSAAPAAGATPAPEQPTAAALIQADVAAGKLDAATGLLYRIEAEFGAPGVPPQYASAPAPEDGSALDRAALTLDKMPAPIHDQVLPFLVRPTDPRSVFYGTGKPAALRVPAGRTATAQVPADVVAGPGAPRGVPADAGVPVCGSNGWASVSSAAIPVTVWGQCGASRNDADLTQALSAIASVYGGEVAVMGDPIPDSGGPDAGGSANIDIYLIDSCLTRDGACHDIPTSAAAVTPAAGPYSGADGSRKSSAYILLYRSYNSPTDLKDLLAHEFFHVLEDAHNLEGRYENNLSYWMTEASAEWAEETFVPEGREHWVYPDLSQFEATTLGLTTHDGHNEYASFVWPYFMTQEMSPVAIGKAWKAFEGKVGWQAFNAALSGVLPFKARFKDFAVRAWNTDMPGGGAPDLIKPRFQQLDAQLPPTGPSHGTKFYFRHPPGLAKTAPPVKVPESMPPLSARYAELELGDDVQQLTVDFSKLAPSGSLDVVAMIHTPESGWQQRDMPKGKSTFCRDEQNVDRVLFVLDDNSYLATDAITGSWEYQAIGQACGPGSFEATVANLGSWDYPAPGTYSGRAQVDCLLNNGSWHATFLDSHGVNNTRDVIIQQSPGAHVHVDTVFMTEARAWLVSQGDPGSTVQVTVDDKGKSVTLTAHAVSIHEKIDAKLTCSTIVRG